MFQTLLQPVLRIAALVLLLCGAASGPAAARDLTIFAAASLKTALDAVAADWEGRGGTPLVISYAGSSALARQIAEGAPADVFLSANEGWMDHIAALGLTLQGSRRDVLGNRLALIAEGPGDGTEGDTIDARVDIPAMLNGGRLAMALVEAVPAGLYGKAALMSLGLWETLEPKVAQVDNVRAALALVATGEAPLGIVYASDAVAEPRVHVVGLFPPESHPAIIYPGAALRGPNEEAALEFLDYLKGEVGLAIFTAQGFTVLP